MKKESLRKLAWYPVLQKLRNFLKVGSSASLRKRLENNISHVTSCACI